MAQLHLDFHYDVSCPFAYIASLRLPALQQRHPTLVINYRPVLLGALYRATAAPQGAAGSASDVFNPTKRTVTSAGFARTLRRLGIEYRQPPKHPQKTTSALRLLYCAQGKDRIALTSALYQAYWVDGLDVSNVATLKKVVSTCAGLDQSVKQSLAYLLETGSFEGAEQRKALEQTTDVALRRGAFGVPAFWLLEEGRLYWGQDRMHFLEKTILSMEKADDLAKEVMLEDLMPRCVPTRAIPACQEVKMEFWYDFSSPWAFLGWTQLARMQRIFGPKLKIEMKPFLLGILFREYAFISPFSKGSVSC
jgi:2-hydroxychromene-2-carboxylate isomerase